jgi:hypothetical protein
MDEEFLAYLQERGSGIDGRRTGTRNKTVTESAAREQLFIQQLGAVVDRMKTRYVVAAPVKKKHGTAKLALSVNLSDLHYGAALDDREVPLAYGHVEEARRTAAVAKWVANHRTREERGEMDLYLNLLGDIIQNQLHDPRDGKPLAEQVAAAIHLLAQFILYVSQAGYRSVTINCTPGNHGRNTARHRVRATNEKWDAIETHIYYALKKIVEYAGLPNTTFNMVYTPFYTYKVFGHSVFCTHGDTVIKPGYPNKAIEVESVRRQINEINGALAPEDKHSVFVVGHVHVSSKVKLPNRVYFMSNGCLIPTDAYGVSLGFMETACCMTVFESTPEHPVGYHCEIDVGVENDKDKALDKIIQPFTGF